jgi:hypothetical protein
MIALIILGEKNKSWSSSLWNFLKYTVNSSLSGPHTLQPMIFPFVWETRSHPSNLLLLILILLLLIITTTTDYNYQQKKRTVISHKQRAAYVCNPIKSARHTFLQQTAPALTSPLLLYLTQAAGMYITGPYVYIKCVCVCVCVCV